MTFHPFYMERFYAKKRQNIPFYIDELLHTLFLATNDMRIAQKAYFQSRCSIDLQKSKNTEYYVDAILREIDQ